MALPKLTEAQKLAHINKIVPLYQKYKDKAKTPILLSILLAQNVHESYFGTSDLYTKYNNVAGMKYKEPWMGRKISYGSGEEIDGKWVDDVKSDFIWFDSIEQSIEYHANFCQNTEWRRATYEKALSATTYIGQAAGLTGTYATDSKYGAKLIEIIEKYDLTKYDKVKEVEKPMRDLMKKLFNTQLRTPLKKHTLVNIGGAISKIEYIVIHFVGASGQALANANYFYNVMRSASAHEFIDPNVTWEVVPVTRVGWHVGDGLGKYGITNQNSLGIEGCQDTSTGKNVWEWQFHENTYIQMILLTSDWMDTYNVPLSRVVRHYDASRKSCPGNWMAYDWAKWKQFKADLKEYRELKAKGIKDVTPTDSANPQGFEQTPVPDYRAPKAPFKPLKVGDVVTYRDNFSWYNIHDDKFIISPNIPTKWAITQDKIVEVKAVETSYSKLAYRMEKSQSWVLEQDLREPREDWAESGANTYIVKHGDYLFKIAEMFGITVAQLKEWNNLESNIIYTDMELFVVKPFEQIPSDESPTSTDDTDGVDEVEDQPEDKGEETPAVALGENEVMDAKGKVYVIREGLVLTEK